MLRKKKGVTGGYLVIERHHPNGHRVVWSARDDKHLIEKINAEAEQFHKDTSGWDLTSVSGCLDYNGHDLQRQRVLTCSDDLDEWDMIDREISYEASWLGWVEEVEDEVNKRVYSLTVLKTEYFNEYVEIEADSEEEAIEKAIEKAHELDFTYLDCEYTAEVEADGIDSFEYKTKLKTGEEDA